MSQNNHEEDLQQPSSNSSSIENSIQSSSPQQQQQVATSNIATLTIEVENPSETQEITIPPTTTTTTTNNNINNTIGMSRIGSINAISTINTKQQQPTSPTTNIASPTVVKPIETKEWQVDFSKFPIVDTDRMKQASKKKLRKKVSQFYEKQNELVEGYAELYTNTVTKEFLKDSDEEGEEGDSFLKDTSADDEKREAAEALERKESRYASFCIQASFWVNVLLLFLKVSASLLSLSLSVITSTIDSILDLVSGLILFYTNLLKKKKSDLHLYPAGKER